MVELYCAPFVELIDRMRLEHATGQRIFDLPRKKWFLPSADGPLAARDLSVVFHDTRAGNPVGPAAGPHTQMAQNLVLSWLAGARILELKTVQIDDRLTIPRPCIDMTNVGYNVEWSQELRIPESLDQYVQGAMLIHMLRAAPEAFGRPFGDVDWMGAGGDTIFDMSVGYDLKGIRSDPVRAFMAGMIDASAEVERLRALIPARLGALRDLDYPTKLSSSITLSTFHGCPADEIEGICEFLLNDLDVDVIVKMNPPMLGKERLEHLLHDVLGYDELTVNPTAYTSGLQFDESIELTRRLTAVAASRGRRFGAKFSNTLEVINHRDFFTPENEVMYLSGQPLHVITLTLADEYRKAVGAAVPISFSAGVDRRNFPAMVACGFAPITTCSDLLRPGGYGRLPAYLVDLAKAMDTVGATTIDAYVLDARGQRDAAGGDVTRAGMLNTSIIADETRNDVRYRAAKNRKVPKRIDSHLVIFDCITCDKCIPVCPNDANFVYETTPVDMTYRDVEVHPDGSMREIGEAKPFRIERQQQIANFADWCNHCGNCDTFCPEYDGPYLEKPSFFGSREAYDAAPEHDGFLLEGDAGALVLSGRIRGRAYDLTQDADGFVFGDGAVRVRLSTGGAADAVADAPAQPHRLDLGIAHTMLALLNGIIDASHVHQVNARLLAEAHSPGSS